MAVWSVDDLFRALKRGTALPPVYYLYGDEDVLKDDAVAALRDAVLDPSTRDFNCDVCQATDLDAETLDALVETPPMLAERRLVVIRGVEGWTARSPARERLKRYLAKPNPTTVLVLLQGAGVEPVSEYAQAGAAVNLEPLPAERAAAWVAHRAKKAGLAIEAAAAELLVAATGGDLAATAAELDKLGGAAADRTITPDDVTRLVGVRRGETAYDLVDAALARDGARAGDLVPVVLAQSEWTGVRLLSLLGTHLLGVALARAELDAQRGGRVEGKLVETLRRIRPRNLRRFEDEAAHWTRWAERWTARELEAAIGQALAADQVLKSTTVTGPDGILEQLVLGFAVRREVAA